MRVPFGIAARRPLNLAVLGAAGLAGVFVALWLLPVGLLVYGALVALTYRDTDLAIALNRPAPVAAPRKTVFQPQIDGVIKTQQAIQEFGRQRRPAATARARGDPGAGRGHCPPGV